MCATFPNVHLLLLVTVISCGPLSPGPVYRGPQPDLAHGGVYRRVSRRNGTPVADIQTVTLESEQKTPSQVWSNTDPNPALISPTRPPTHKIQIGDWMAVWDYELSYWYFYNVKTEESTWEQPAQLAHLAFSNVPKGGAGGSGPQQKFSSHPIAYHSYHLAPVNTLQARYKAQPKQLAGNNGLFDNSNDFVDSSNCLTFECRQRNVANVVVPDGGFFGFNTSVFASRGLAGGVYANLAGIYDNIVQAYVEDVYTDVIEGYTIATIKLIGWFFFGSFLIVKGAVLNSLNDGRSFDGLDLADEFEGTNVSSVDMYKVPWLEDLDLTFPMDRSIMSCYKERNSCINNDFPTEFNLLLSNLSNMKEFAWNWLELGERIGHMVEEGETEL